MEVVTHTEIPEYPLLARGKVRDIYALDDERLLIVTTDRMSAFDVVMQEPIPLKGVVLNQITIFWMERFAGLVPNHLLETDVAQFPQPLATRRSQLEGRSVIVRKTAPLPIECVVRGHITGSGWKDYQRTGAVCGVTLPPGLRESEKLSAPLFTPSTKAEIGQHDENITRDEAVVLAGAPLVEEAERLSLALFTQGRDFAESRGLIIADTKFEFGQLPDGQLILIDEVLTPDSSRFWPMDGFEAGKSQPSFDKQYLRDYLASLDWNKEPPPPPLPDEIVAQTRDRYLDAYERLTGSSLKV